MKLTIEWVLQKDTKRDKIQIKKKKEKKLHSRG
jgi:hypothetical protein